MALKGMKMTMKGTGFRFGRAAALAAAVLMLFASAQAGEIVYEYAYVRILPDYAIYYVFDMDTMTVRQFRTNDSGALVGTFTGDMALGADICYRKDWHESFRPVSPGEMSMALITDYSGFTFEYTRTDASAAAAILEGGGYTDIRLE